MQKHEILKKITEVGVVAVVRAETSEQAIEISKACIKGGITAVEVTFTVPNANEAIEGLAKTFKPSELIVGAGTVLNIFDSPCLHIQLEEQKWTCQRT